ncbi:MAG: SDR family NAD(P)-dependent oxidoreductase [Hyphomonadaceae bacterium]
MLQAFSLAGKTAFITGAGRGIGKGIAEVFAEAGADVAINALTDTYLAPLVESIGARTGRKIFGLAGDCTTPQGADTLAHQAVAALGRIDILVNNLGDALAAPLAPDADGAPAATDEQISKVLNINLMAAIYCTRAVVPGMLARGSGKIINTSGFAGLRGSPTMAMYATAKTALVGLTRSLALEWAASGVTVNAIAPGIFPDPVAGAPPLTADLEAHYKSLVPMRRFGALREAGLLALYLASEASDYMTGQVLALDGGMSA